MMLPTMTLKLALGAIVFGAAQLFAAPITIFNTGIADANGLDTHYKLTAMPSGANYGSVPYVLANASGIYPAPTVPPTTAGFTSWIATPTTPGSNWIGPLLIPNTYGNNIPGTVAANRTFALPGTYDYATTFDLSSIAPASAVLTGQWAADGAGINIILNGRPTGLATQVPTAGTTLGSYTAFTPFAIDNTTCPGCFVSGKNTLTFEVANGLVESGVRVNFTSANGTLVVPEPSSWFTFGTGLGVLGLLRRRR